MAKFTACNVEYPGSTPASERYDPALMKLMGNFMTHLTDIKNPKGLQMYCTPDIKDYSHTGTLERKNYKELEALRERVQGPYNPKEISGFYAPKSKLPFIPGTKEPFDIWALVDFEFEFARPSRFPGRELPFLPPEKGKNPIFHVRVLEAFKATKDRKRVSARMVEPIGAPTTVEFMKAQHEAYEQGRKLAMPSLRSILTQRFH